MRTNRGNGENFDVLKNQSLLLQRNWPPSPWFGRDPKTVLQFKKGEGGFMYTIESCWQGEAR